MRKNFLKLALAVAMATTVVTTAPLIGSAVGQPVTVYANTQTQRSETINGVTYYEPTNTFKNFYNPTYKPIHPMCINIWNGVYDTVYFMGTLYQVEEYNTGKLPKPTLQYGELTVNNGEAIKNGSDITKYITNASTVENYLDRVSFRYTAGYEDTVSNAKKGTSTKYTFTAPITGVVKFRWVMNEQHGIYTGVDIFDSNGERAQYYGADLMVGSNYGNYVNYKVEKGKQYTLRFATKGTDTQQKFEMFFIKSYDNKNGTATYSQNEWHVYNMPEDPYNMDLGLGSDSENNFKRMRMVTLPITLKEESKVTVNLRSLNFAYEGWTAVLKVLSIHDKKKMDTLKLKDWDYSTTIYKDLKFTGLEIGLTSAKVEFTLPAGSYYIPIANNSYGKSTDVAFKYTITPTGKKTITEPELTKPYTDDTAVKGTCEKGAKVTVTISGKNYTTSDTSKGTFSIKVPKLKKGASIKVKQSKSGVTSKTVTTKVVDDSFLNSKLTSVITTNGGDTVLSGKCYKGTTVVAKVGSKEYKDTTTKSGSYSIKVPKIKAGTKITITQKNSTSSKSRKTTQTAVNLTITKIEYSAGKYKVYGKCNKNETVSIKVGSKTYTDKLTKKGTYCISIPTQKSSQDITITQGNGTQTVVRRLQSKVSLMLKYYKPSVAAKKNNYYVTGNSICKGADVYVKINGKTYKGKVDNSGKYKVKTTRIKKNSKIYVYVKSGSVKSKTNSITVK